MNNGQLTVHTHRMVVYLVTKSCENTFNEVKPRAAHYAATYYLVNEICGIRKRIGSFQVRVEWSWFKYDADMTGEQVGSIKEDVVGMLKNFSHTAGDRNLKREVLDLYFLTKYLIKKIFKGTVISRSLEQFDGKMRYYLCTTDFSSGKVVMYYLCIRSTILLIEV